MNTHKPKIGLLLLTAEWFAQIGAHGGSFSDLPRTLDEDAAQIHAALKADLAEVAKRYDLDPVAIKDVGEELHRVLGLRPCLAVPELFQRAVVSMEAEVGGAAALLMLKHLSGRTPTSSSLLPCPSSLSARCAAA